MAKIFICGLVFLLLTACSPQSSEQMANTDAVSDNKTSTFEVTDVWARATFAMAQTGAVYLTLNNQTETDVSLLSASVSSDLADEVQLHDMAMNDGMMQMQEMVDGVNVNIGETLEFRPGGKHIMLLGLKKPLNDGDSFELTLRFKNRDELTLLVNVKDARNLN